MREAVAPRANRLEETLQVLTGLDVTVTDTTEGASGPGYACEFISYKSELMGAIGCIDITPAAGLGAGLSMIPVAAAIDQIEAGRLEGAVYDNFLEVMNVLSGLFDRPDHPGFHQGETFDRESSLDRIAMALPTVPTEANYRVDVPGVGSGVLSFLT